MSKTIAVPWFGLLIVSLLPFATLATPNLASQLLQQIEQRSEHELQTRNGAKLGYFSYLAPEKPNTALIYLHGLHDHVGWFELTAKELTAHGYDVYLMDRRGSGVNQSSRNFVSGHIESWHDWLDDLDDMVQLLRSSYSQVHIIGHSWGGKLAIAYSLSHPDRTNGLLLITPDINAKAQRNGFNKLSIAVCHLFCQQSQQPITTTAAMLASAAEWQHFIQQDPRLITSVTAEFIWQTHRMDKWIHKNINQLNRSTLLILAGQDKIIANDKVTALLFKGQQPTSVHHYPNQAHAIQLTIPERLATDMAQWLQQKQQQP